MVVLVPVLVLVLVLVLAAATMRSLDYLGSSFGDSQHKVPSEDHHLWPLPLAR